MARIKGRPKKEALQGMTWNEKVQTIMHGENRTPLSALIARKCERFIERMIWRRLAGRSMEEILMRRHAIEADLTLKVREALLMAAEELEYRLEADRLKLLIAHIEMDGRLPFAQDAIRLLYDVDALDRDGLSAAYHQLERYEGMLGIKLPRKPLHNSSGHCSVPIGGHRRIIAEHEKRAAESKDREGLCPTRAGVLPSAKARSTRPLLRRDSIVLERPRVAQPAKRVQSSR